MADEVLPENDEENTRALYSVGLKKKDDEVFRAQEREAHEKLTSFGGNMEMRSQNAFLTSMFYVLFLGNKALPMQKIT